MKKLLLATLIALILTSSVKGATLSLDKVTFTSMTFPIVGDAFLVWISQVGTQDYLVGTFKKFQTDEINQKLEEEGYRVRVTYPLSVKSTLKDRECWWNLAWHDQYLKTANIIWKKTCYFPPCPSVEDCAEDGGEYFVKRPWSYDYYCIDIIPVKKIGYFSPDKIHYEVEFYVSNDRESRSEVFTEEEKSGWLLQDKVWVEWTGNMIGEKFEICPTTDIEQNIYPVMDLTTEDKWTASAYYRDYYDQFCSIYEKYYCAGDFEDCLLGEGIWSDWSVEDCVDELNYRQILASEGAVWEDPETGEETWVEDGKLKWEMVRDYIIPTFRYIIKADWLGIYIPSGKPSITSVRVTQPIDSELGYGFVTVTVKNVGEEDGTFDIKVTCPSPWTGRTVTDYFGAGEEKDVTIRVDGSCVEEETKTCEVIVTDRASGESVSRSFEMSCKPIVECQNPCQVECLYNVIRHCRTDGRWEVLEVCSIGKCAWIAGKYRCEYGDDDGDGVLNKDDKCPDEAGRPEYDGCPTPPCEWWDIPCWFRRLYETLKYWFLVIIGLIIGAIVLFILIKLRILFR